MRTVDIEIGGVKYPLCFTLAAVEQFYARYGDIDGWFERLKELSYTDEEHPGDTIKLFAEHLWLLDTLLFAGYDHVRLTDGEVAIPPDLDALRHMLCAGDLVRVRQAVIQAISLGNQREVGAQPAKNGEGAPGDGQAPTN